MHVTAAHLACYGAGSGSSSRRRLLQIAEPPVTEAMILASTFHENLPYMILTAHLVHMLQAVDQAADSGYCRPQSHPSWRHKQALQALGQAESHSSFDLQLI